MFIDNVQVEVKAGNGGNGVVSFRREKFVDKGGPNGGDGGDGGDIYLIGSEREHTLAKFRYNKQVESGNGSDGGSNNKHGKSADELEVNVPVGTVAINQENGELVADITEAGQRVKIANGGKGGFGNSHFKSSTRQAPAFAEKGTPGDELQLKLELRLIADVALVGLPNAGKSTLLSVISNARPEIADYPFTTLTPNLGVVDFRGESILFADIPGLIEKASEGKGLGHEFLKHVQRTKAIVHLIDIYSPDIVASYKVIRTELETYSDHLAKLPEVVALSKADGLSEPEIAAIASKLQPLVKPETPIVGISSQAHQNIEIMLDAVAANLKAVETTEKLEEQDGDDQQEVVFGLSAEESDSFSVTKKRKAYVVTGKKIERFAHKTYFDDQDSLHRLRDIMHKLGILHELSRLGYEPGQEVAIGDPEIGRLEL